MKKIFLILPLLWISQLVVSQVTEPVKWKFTMEKIEGGFVDIIATGTIEETWKTYGTQLAEGGPVKTSFGVTTEGAELEGETIEVTPSTEGYDSLFEMNITYFKEKVVLKQRYKLAKDQETIVGYIEFMACDNAQCLPPKEIEFTFNVN